MNYKLKGVGIEAADLHHGLHVADLYHCVLDDIEGAQELGEIEIPESSKIICKSNFSDNLGEHVEVFKSRTSRYPDVILISSKNSWDIEGLKEFHKKYPNIEIGIYVEPKCTGKTLESIVESIGYDFPINFFGMSLNPAAFNWDAIQWIRDEHGENPELIGFNVQGDKYMRNYIVDSFSKPYLLEFAAFYCTALILDSPFSMVDIQYASSLISQEVKDPAIFKLESTVYQRFPDLKKIISPKVKFMDSCELVVDNLEFLLNPESMSFAFGLVKNDIPENDPELFEVLENVKPGGGYYSLLYSALNTYLEEKVKDKKLWWEGVDKVRIAEDTYIFSIKKKVLTRKYLIAPNEYGIEPKNYLLALRDGKVIIKELP